MTKNKQNVVIRKLLWFKEAIGAEEKVEKMCEESSSDIGTLKNKPVYSMPEIHSLIDLFAHFFYQIYNFKFLRNLFFLTKILSPIRRRIGSN